MLTPHRQTMRLRDYGLVEIAIADLAIGTLTRGTSAISVATVSRRSGRGRSALRIPVRHTRMSTETSEACGQQKIPVILTLVSDAPTANENPGFGDHQFPRWQLGATV